MFVGLDQSHQGAPGYWFVPEDDKKEHNHKFILAAALSMNRNANTNLLEFDKMLLSLE